MRISPEDYVARIANASQIQLVVINYEIILDYLGAAKASAEAEEEEDLDFDIAKARQFLNELRSSLDMQYKISKYLMSLYIYIDRELAYCLFGHDTEHIDEAVRILEKLLAGWKEVEKIEEDKTPLMENTEQLYAGLTYKKDGTLNEYVDTKSNRGFKA